MVKKRLPPNICPLCNNPCWGKNCSNCVREGTNGKLSRFYNRRNKNPYNHMNNTKKNGLSQRA